MIASPARSTLPQPLSVKSHEGNRPDGNRSVSVVTVYGTDRVNRDSECIPRCLRRG